MTSFGLTTVIIRNGTYLKNINKHQNIHSKLIINKKTYTNALEHVMSDNIVK